FQLFLGEADACTQQQTEQGKTDTDATHGRLLRKMWVVGIDNIQAHPEKSEGILPSFAYASGSDAARSAFVTIKASSRNRSRGYPHEIPPSDAWPDAGPRRNASRPR